ncbi:MAG TPA: LytR family transcriptional regulator [Ruminococcaceae bacterium]|jgi:LCP family protein required for cell wall assembly|nr:LytR family transcriptional regulator [Oscillospiraceae bacterium]HBG56364.1 LytR family transcriptional regulator [Oscillospiraceae bacterium]HBQ45848.1 LytR family transcriptional regulator [Oscillospiraceae bacterium]
MSRNSGRPSGRDIYSSSRRYSSDRRRGGYNPNDIDRYNYVDRDIYSSSPRRRRPARKGGCLKRALTVLLVAVLLAAGAGLIYFHVLASRLNRSDNVTGQDLESYVQQPSDAPAWDVKSDGGVMNILLLGVDENKDGTDGRSDTNILLSIDRNSKALHLVSFLRDTYLEIPTVGKSKLNTAFTKGGAALTMQTLENNYRVNIDKYVSVNFENFAAVIDKMGGLDVKMSQSACRQENKNMGSHLKPGVNHLNGRLCLYYARIRDASDDYGVNDFGRAGRQRQVIELMIQKMKSLNPIESNKILYDYLPYVKTNLNDGELLYLASITASVSGYDVKSLQMPADNAYKDEKKSVGEVLVPDLEKNCALLREFLYPNG